MTNIYSLLGEPDEALVSGKRALEIAERLGDLRLRLLTTTYLEQAHYFCGEFARVIELAIDNLAALPPDWAHECFGGTQPPSVNDRCWLFLSLAQLGRFAEAAAYEAEAIRLAESTYRPYTVGVAYQSAGALHVVKDDWASARALLERAIAVLRTADIVDNLPLVLAYSACALAGLGDGENALGQLREAESLLEIQAARGRAGNHGFPYHALGRACLLLGRLDEARRLVGRAVDAASRRIDVLPRALHLLGDIASHSDRFDAERAEAHYREALALAEPRGMRPLVAHCHLGLGTLYSRSGRRREAREHLITAATMYREMDMRRWLEQAEAAREKEEIPIPAPP